MSKPSFWGREEYLVALKKRVSGLLEGYRQNVAFLGDELTGKTALLTSFLESFYDTRIIPVYIDVMHEPVSSFVKRYIGVYLYNFLSHSGITLNEDLEFLLDKASRHAPMTVEKMRAILHAAGTRRKSTLFPDLLSLSDLIYQETGKSTLIIFDEFQNLENLGIANLYRDWGKFLMAQKHVMYVISSSMKYRAKEILSRDLSLLFGNFEIIAFDPFDSKETGRYLNSLLADTRFPASLRHFIIHFTGGYPLYTRIIAEAMHGKESASFSSVLERLLFDASGTLHQRFSNYIKRFTDLKQSQDYLSILYLIATGCNKTADIAGVLHRNKTDAFTRINYLVELDTITRNGDFLKINDRVFGFWLRFVYREQLAALTCDARNQKAQFRDMVDAMIKDFEAHAQRTVPERFMDILRQFSDEMMHIERNKIRLNSFREVKHLEFENKHFREGLIGRSHECVWILAFKNDFLTEDDVAAFSRECKKYRSKEQRKIIVTLADDIDTNTRLRAFEEKVMTWDLKSLNQMFDMFQKPAVIVG